jgi:hypothetical protein
MLEYCRWPPGKRRGEKSSCKAPGARCPPCPASAPSLDTRGMKVWCTAAACEKVSGLFVPPPQGGKRLLFGVDFIEGVAFEELAVFHVFDRVGVANVVERILVEHHKVDVDEAGNDGLSRNVDNLGASGRRATVTLADSNDAVVFDNDVGSRFFCLIRLPEPWEARTRLDREASGRRWNPPTRSRCFRHSQNSCSRRRPR